MYIDPGTGSIVLQVVAAAALTGVAMVGRLRQAVRAFFASWFTRRPK